MQTDLRRNGSGFGEFWREYWGIVPIITAAAGAVAAGSLAGLTESVRAVSQGAIHFYSLNPTDITRSVTEVYKMGADAAGSYLFPGWVAGQFIGYKFKQAVKPLIGLK